MRAPLAQFSGVLRPEFEATLRPDQRAPAGDWLTWLLLAGRGFGKTFALAAFASECAERWPGSRGFIAAATLADVRDTVLQGESGLLTVAARPPRYLESKGHLLWPNGSRALVLTAEKPARGRGKQYHWGVADEVMIWPGLDKPGSLWGQLEIGLRLPARPGWLDWRGPRCAVATTPQSKPWLRRKLAEALLPDGTTARAGSTWSVTRGRTLDNRANLDPKRLAALLAELQGTPWGRQELDGEMLTDAEGALWSSEGIERHRRPEHPMLSYVVVAVDPSVGDGTGDACGIVVVGVCERGELWVLADYTVNGPPELWAARVAAARHAHSADLVVAEKNQGGELVRQALLNADVGMPITLVVASKGKRARAEPISGLYAVGLVHHVSPLVMLAGAVDPLAGLESELTGWAPHDEDSPNRLDALVWGCTQLLPHVRGGQAMRERAAHLLAEAQRQSLASEEERDRAIVREQLAKQAGLAGRRRSGRR